jgi:hypothetical protein
MYLFILKGLIGIGLIFSMLFLFIVFREKLLSSKWMKKRRLKQLIKYKKIDKIHFFEEEPAPGFEFPLSLKEVEGFVEKVQKNRPTAVQGIASIGLKNRPESLRLSIFGAYHRYETHRSPEGSTIDLYPMKTEGDSYRLYLYSDEIDEGMPIENDMHDRPYILFTKEQARQELLHTLGHELGHSLIFNLEKRLHDDGIEDLCDTWGVQFGGNPITYEELKSCSVYKRGREIGTFEEVL